MIRVPQWLTAVTLVVLSSAATAVPQPATEEAESELAVWTEADEQRSERFMELLLADPVDVAAAVAALDELSIEQQQQMIGPLDFEGEAYWPLSGFLTSFAGDGESGKVGPMIEFGEAMAQRLSTDAQRGHWLAWVSRTRLQAGVRPELAREAALQARALGTQLCRGDCGPLVEAWLSDADLTDTPGLAASEVFDPRPVACEEQPRQNPYMFDPGAYSDAWLRVVLGRLENAVATDMDLWWRAASRGCSAGNTYALKSRIDGEYPPMLVQQSYASAERAVGLSQPPSTVSFLGHVLALPSRECDFSKAADCSLTQRLRAETARALIHQLRGLSSSLRPVAMCMPGLEGEEKQWRDALTKRFDGEIETLTKVPAAIAIVALERLLVDESFIPLQDERASYKVRDLLVTTALAGESARALSLWQNILPTLEYPRAAHQQVLAKLLLHQQRANEAASILKQLSSSGAEDSAARAWLQLRAALEGADLSAQAPAPSRTWHAMVHESSDWHGGIDTDVTAEDILIGTLAPAKLLDHLLQSGWVAHVESPWLRPHALMDVLNKAYPGERWTAEVESALSTLSDEPEPGFVLVGRWLPAPDEVCDEEGCQPIDRAGLRALLVAREWLPSQLNPD